MGSTTKIEWAEKTWNPVVGCTQISPGCANCYAKTIAERFGPPAYPNGFDVTLKPHKMDEPKRWKTPSRIFVNSMSDLFHEDVPRNYVEKVFETMKACPQHQFLILTKRPERMREFWNFYADCDCGPVDFGGCDCWGTPLPNVWLGVSVENKRFMSRVEILREIPAAVRFVSFEPLLGRIPSPDLTGVDWAIIGGESGPGSRPMHPLWLSEILFAAEDHNCVAFVKQMGTVWARENGAKHNKGGDPDEWPDYLQLPRRFPEVAHG